MPENWNCGVQNANFKILGCKVPKPPISGCKVPKSQTETYVLMGKCYIKSGIRFTVGNCCQIQWNNRF